MAAIERQGENPRAFRYAMTSRTTIKPTTDARPKIAPQLRKCATIETKVGGCTAYIMIDTGSTGNFVSPAFARVTGMKTFPLEQQLTLQLGCIGSRSKITHGGSSNILLGGKASQIYFDVANIDRYDCILGIPFLREHSAVIDFAKQCIRIGDVTIALSEEEELVKRPVRPPQHHH
jgi:hypothetical protein